MKLIPNTNDGVLEHHVGTLPQVALEILEATAKMYASGGYRPPWIGYLVTEDGDCVGTCAFKAPPAQGCVEIAFFTFPGRQGRGVATRMVNEFVRLSRDNLPDIRIIAQTLPLESASTRVLRKTGFRMLKIVDHPQDGRVWEWELKNPEQPHPHGV